MPEYVLIQDENEVIHVIVVPTEEMTSAELGALADEAGYTYIAPAVRGGLSIPEMRKRARINRHMAAQAEEMKGK